MFQTPLRFLAETVGNNMNKIYFLLVFVFCFQISTAQKRKCYIRMFEFDSKYQKKEIDCKKFDEMHDGIITKEDSIINRQFKIKLAEYQEKLIELGYDFEANGKLSKAFIKAHHKYLRKRKKANRNSIKTDT